MFCCLCLCCCCLCCCCCCYGTFDFQRKSLPIKQKGASTENRATTNVATSVYHSVRQGDTNLIRPIHICAQLWLWPLHANSVANEPIFVLANLCGCFNIQIYDCSMSNNGTSERWQHANCHNKTWALNIRRKAIINGSPDLYVLALTIVLNFRLPFSQFINRF